MWSRWSGGLRPRLDNRNLVDAGVPSSPGFAGYSRDCAGERLHFMRSYTQAVQDKYVPGLRYSSEAQELWALLWQVGGGLFAERFNATAASLGLSPVSAGALMQLLPGEPISQKELSERLHCSPSTVVDPTDRLERMGLVERIPHSKDRRINMLVVTEDGRQLRDRFIARVFEPPEALLSIAAGDRLKFLSVLRELLAARSKRPRTADAAAR
jgi:DNA-binding MarR family transcriptional regulator